MKVNNMIKIETVLLAVILLLLTVVTAGAQTIVERGTSKVCSLDSSGKLIYSKDKKGNCLPDFSHAGYHSGERAIPDVPVRMTLEPSEDDDTSRIQESLDKLGTLPQDKTGFRGALLLKRGVYRVEGRLRVSRSGIVLRGQGNGPDGTVIVATGYGDKKYKRALITVGNSNRIKIDTASKQPITDAYVPVGSHCFEVKSVSGYKPGDRIVLYRPSIPKWIRSIGCDKLKPRWTNVSNTRWVKVGRGGGFYYQRPGSHSESCLSKSRNESWDDFVKRVPLTADGKKLDVTQQWQAREYDFYFERRITGIEGNRITIDAPIVHSIDREFGGGAIYRYTAPGRVTEASIENLRLVSEFAAPTPGHPYGGPKEMTRAERHAWHGIKLSRNTENTWVRGVTGNYFGWSLVSASGKRGTIQDCVNLGHASKIEGGRRYPFMIDGQLNLVQRCIAYAGRHEFVTQAKTAGPNVFVDCIGYKSKSSSGPHHRYSVGTLFDNVKSERPMESRFRGNSGTGHGWAGAQSCFYNCVATGFVVEAPPGGISWVIGSAKSDEQSSRVTPASLYYQQVQDRLGKAALDRLATAEQKKKLGKYLWVEERLKNEAISN